MLAEEMRPSFRTHPAIDGSARSRYSGRDPQKDKEGTVAVKSVQLGQVWRKDDDGKDYLVTKVYSEVFAQYAMLRPAEVSAPDAPTVRVKVAKTPQGASLPGFTFTQEGTF